ncbi:MAG: lamin tail domain-containing protein [Candidatus Glassbacteria bacterium]
MWDSYHQFLLVSKMEKAVKITLVLIIIPYLSFLAIPDLESSEEAFVIIDDSHGQTQAGDLLKNSVNTASQVNVNGLPGLDQKQNLSSFGSLIIDEFGHSVKSWEEESSLTSGGGKLNPLVESLVVIASPLDFFSLEEKRVLADYLRIGGSVFLVAGTCVEKSGSETELPVLNDLIEGFADEGLDPGFRFEDTMHPASSGTVRSSTLDDPIMRGSHGEVRELGLTHGHTLHIDSFLNPSVRAFSLETSSGDKWPFLAASVVGGGKVAAFGAGGALMDCSPDKPGEFNAERESFVLVRNLLSWLIEEKALSDVDGADSSRVIVNEVMWGGEATREYVELLNLTSREIQLEGWTLTDGEGVYILKGTIAAGGFYLLEYDEAATPVMADEVYGDDSPLLVLGDEGDRLSLLDRWGDIVAVVNREELNWPAGFADGHGASMELINERYDYSPQNWRNSVGGEMLPYGTPRAVNSTKVIAPFIPDFRASIAEGKIVLQWVVDKAESVSHFNLYRSNDVSLNPSEQTGTYSRVNSLPIPPDSSSFVDLVVDSSLACQYLLGVVMESGIEKFSQPVVISLRGFEEPKRYSVRMDQNFPNPFNPNTEIHFEIEDLLGSSKPIEVDVSVFSPRGHMVRRLYERSTYPGSFSVRWDGRDDNGEEVGSGAYYYQLLVTDIETGQILVRLSRKMVLMR